MPVGSADQPCANAGDGEHLWSHNAVLGMQCSGCGASRPYDPERDPPPPRYGPRRRRRRRARKRESMFDDHQRPEHRDLPIAELR